MKRCSRAPRSACHSAHGRIGFQYGERWTSSSMSAVPIGLAARIHPHPKRMPPPHHHSERTTTMATTLAPSGLSFELSDDLKLLKTSIREFVEHELWPLSDELEDTDDIPKSAIDKMKEMGLFGLPFSEEYGGAGVGELSYCIALEELGRASACFSNVLGAHCSIGAMALHLDGSPELKKIYMPKLCTGKLTACFALSEPNAGSDAASIQTS